MARPREFDTDQALDAALHEFWQRGYASTSMADLMRAMGLQKGSIYKAWRDKRDLFLCALRRYQGRVLAEFQRTVSRADSPREALRAWLGSVSRNCKSKAPAPGCFGVNAVVELAPHDEEVAALAAAQRKAMRQALIRLIEEGQERGEISSSLDPATVASMLHVFLGGLAVASKETPALRDTSRLCDLVMRSLDP